MNVLTTEKRTAIVRALVEGNSIRATCRLTGAAKGTVLKLLGDLGRACAAFHDRTVVKLRPAKVQADEVWTFSGSKEKNIPSGKKGHEDFGSVWTWTAMDADSKLMISFLVGRRDSGCARTFIDDLAGRVTNRIQLSTDGLKLYVNAVEESFGGFIDYGIIHKVYGADRPEEARYSPAICTGCVKHVEVGDPDLATISTSFVERQNLTLRMQNRRFTRLTNAFTRKVENLRHAVALHLTYYNFCRRHMTLKTTPAVAAGLADRAMSVEDLVGLIEASKKWGK